MELQQYITDKKIDGTLLERLNQLGAADSSAISGLVAALMPSANTLRELLRLAEEISRRDRSSIRDVLEADDVKIELSSQGKSRKEKQKFVRLILETKRYPLRSELRKRLAENAAVLTRNFGLRVTVPEDLEGAEISLEITARSIEELADAGRKLQAASEHPAAQDIFAVLRGDY